MKYSVKRKIFLGNLTFLFTVFTVNTFMQDTKWNQLKCVALNHIIQNILCELNCPKHSSRMIIIMIIELKSYYVSENYTAPCWQKSDRRTSNWYVFGPSLKKLKLFSQSLHLEIHIWNVIQQIKIDPWELSSFGIMKSGRFCGGFHGKCKFQNVKF